MRPLSFGRPLSLILRNKCQVAAFLVCRSPGERGFCCGGRNARNLRFLPGPSPAVQKTRRGSARQKRSRILAALGPSLGGTVASPAARRQQRRNRSKNQIRASDIFKATPRRLAQRFSAERLCGRLRRGFNDNNNLFSLTFPSTVGGVNVASSNNHINVVRAGLSYKF